MSNRITDARIEELQRLKSLKDKVREKIQNELDGMQDLYEKMNNETRDSVSAASKAAKTARGKESSSLGHEDVLEAHKIAIARLEEQFAKNERELQDLEEARCSK